MPLRWPFSLQDAEQELGKCRRHNARRFRGMVNFDDAPRMKVEMSYGFSPLSERHHFSQANLSAPRCRASPSANSCFSLAFSSSKLFGFLASDTSTPPYFDFQM